MPETPSAPTKKCATLPGWARKGVTHSPLGRLAGVPCTPPGAAAVLRGVPTMTEGAGGGEERRVPWQRESGARAGVHRQPCAGASAPGARG